MFYKVNCELEEDVIRPKNQIKTGIIIFLKRTKKQNSLINPKNNDVGWGWHSWNQCYMQEKLGKELSGREPNRNGWSDL